MKIAFLFQINAAFPQFILRRKKGNKPSNITYGCANNLNWKIYSTSFIKFIGRWNIFHKFLLTCICRLTRWRQLVDMPPSAKWWCTSCNTHNLPGIPRSHVHVRLLNLSIVHVATCEFSIYYKIILWFFTRFKYIVHCIYKLWENHTQICCPNPLLLLDRVPFCPL